MERPFLQSTSTNVPTLWSGDPDAQNKVTSSANVTDLSWALSIGLRKHRDVRLSDCPNRDLPKLSAGHEEPSTLTGRDLRLAVETGGTAVSHHKHSSPASLPVLQKQTVIQQLMDPRGSHAKGRMQVGALI